MEGNNNWQNFERNPAPRGRNNDNNRGNRRPDNENEQLRFGELPPPYTASGNRQNNPHRYYENPGPNLDYGAGESNLPNKHLKAKSFPAQRPTPYDRPESSKQPEDFPEPSHEEPEEPEEPSTSVPKELTPLELKINNLIAAVRSQSGVAGLLVLLQSDLESPAVILQNAVQSLRNGVLKVIPKESSQIFELTINGEIMASGLFGNKQVAKNQLAEIVLQDIKKKCFYILKKRNYEEISTDTIAQGQKDPVPPNAMEGSKAHLMMLKMGWGGKGLGSNEQGEEKTVAETLTQNVTKEGFGNKNVMNEIQGVLEEFAGGLKVTTLAFDSGFTKDERAHIHTIASRLNLKSKSEGKDENRRITISKKIARWNLVRELLMIGCENDSYKLIIPPEFENIWKEDEQISGI